MSVSEQTQRFMQLFRGRTDALGDGGPNGGCVRTVVCDVDYERHLTGARPIGVYPVTDDGTCAWGCVDIDFDDYQLARALVTCLETLGIQGHIERSRSKGYHVWVFSQEWVRADTMRKALQAVCQIIGYSPKEVNPKQTELMDGQLGNYVRLPYPGGHVRQVMLGHATAIGAYELELDAWLDTVRPTERNVFSDAAALYVEPPKPKRLVLTERVIEGDLTDKLNGLAWVIYKNGPLEGSDRSSTLAKLAHECQRSGLTASEALSIVTDADRAWGKYSTRFDGPEQLTKLIQAAY